MDVAELEIGGGQLDGGGKAPHQIATSEPVGRSGPIHLGKKTVG